MPEVTTDHGHPRSTRVAQLWPVDTDLHFSSGLGKVKLTDQTPIVQATITDAFDFLHASIIFEHAFPDALLTSKFIQDALTTASLHIPNAEDVHVRILNDHAYCSKMSTLVYCTCFPLRTQPNEGIQP